MSQAEVEAVTAQNQQYQIKMDQSATGNSSEGQSITNGAVNTENVGISGDATYHYNAPPPHFGGTQYGMPYPAGPWGMQWQHPHQQQRRELPAKNLIVKPGVIEPQVIYRAAEWSEYRTPDGRPYYYHAGRGESVWEKPQAIRDLEGK